MQGRVRWGWVFIFFLALPAWGGGLPETPQFRTLTTADGLPSINLGALAQDGEGYIWVATRNGAARFDGEEFHQVEHDPADPYSPPNSAVTALHVDRAGNVWVGMDGFGARRFNSKRGTFDHVPGAASPIDGTSVMVISSTRDGSVWFGTLGHGLFKLDSTGHWSQFLEPKPGPAGSAVAIYALAEQDDGSFWAGTSTGLFHLQGKEFVGEPVGGVADPVVVSLKSGREGLWIGTTQGPWLRNVQGNFSVPSWGSKLPHPIVFSMLLDRHGTRWLTTPAGLARVKGDDIDVVAEGGLHGFGFGQNLVEDREGDLWIGQRGVGVLRLPARWREFAIYPSGDGETKTSARWVRAVALSRSGGAWLAGVGGGLDYMDPASGHIRHVVASHELSSCHAISITERVDQSVWVGCMDSKLVRIDSGNSAITDWTPRSVDSALLRGVVAALHEDANGLWVAVIDSGLQLRDLSGRILREFQFGDEEVGLPREVLRIGRGPNNDLWLATAEGIVRWRNDLGRFEHVPGSPKSKVLGFGCFDSKRCWISRAGALEAYSWQGGLLQRTQRVTRTDGLPSSGLGGILVDKKGDAWITTAQGLVHVTASPLAVHVVGSDTGMVTAEFDTMPAVMMASGIIVAPTMSNLVAFDTNAIAAPRLVPELSFASVSLRRNDGTVEFARDVRRIMLQPQDRDLRITARIHSLSNPSSRRFRFRLQGYDPAWVEDREGERVFTRLEHGSYVLEAIAANADGVWSKPIRLEIVVLPAWWQTTQARLGFVLAALMVLLAVGAAYRTRLRNLHAAKLLEQRRQLAEQASAAKTRFLADLAHEIRTPMTGVLGMAELLHADASEAKQQRRVEAIQSAGQHLLQLLNDALDLAKIEAGRLELQSVVFDLPGLLTDVCVLLRPQAESKALTFDLDIAPDLGPGVRGDPVRLRQILLNLGHNAVKFTATGGVTVRATELDGGLCIDVADTGKGLDAEQQARLFQRFEQADGSETSAQYGGSGLGLSICREIARALGGDITVASTPGSGARFRVLLPLHEAELPEPPRSQLRIGEAQGESARILLVDDDALIAEVVGELLARQGHGVTRAAHGLEAMAMVSTDRFDLILLDLDLPGMDGATLARIWKEQGLDVPIVALTARVDAEVVPLAQSLGMLELVRKPVSGEMLDAVVRRHARVQANAAAPYAKVEPTTA